MNEIWQAFKLLTSHGIGFLRLFDELSPHDLSDEGIEVSLAKNYARLATELLVLATPHACSTTLSPSPKKRN